MNILENYIKKHNRQRKLEALLYGKPLINVTEDDALNYFVSEISKSLKVSKIPVRFFHNSDKQK